MQRVIRPPPRANPGVPQDGGPNGSYPSPMATNGGQQGNDLARNTTPELKRGVGGPAYQSPYDISSGEKRKMTPRGMEVQENPPFDDPLFDQMVKDEMARLEAEIALELNQQSQVLDGNSISPEGKQLAAHMVQSGRINLEDSVTDDNHPYAYKEAQNGGPGVGAMHLMNTAPQLPTSPVYEREVERERQARQREEQAAAAVDGNDRYNAPQAPSPVNVAEWKRKGYPSEYAYAQTNGALEIPRAQPRDLFDANNNNNNAPPAESTEVISNVERGGGERRQVNGIDDMGHGDRSPVRRKGYGGMKGMHDPNHDVNAKYAAQEEYRRQLDEHRAYGNQQQHGNGPRERNNEDRYRNQAGDALEARLKEVGVERQGQGVYGRDTRTEKQLKRDRQEEYRRQLDYEKNASAIDYTAPAPPRAAMIQQSDEERREAVQSSYVVPVLPGHGQGEEDMAKMMKRKQQEAYREQLKEQMDAVNAQKEARKKEKEMEDMALLEEAAAMAAVQPQVYGPQGGGGGGGGGNMNINSFEPSKENMFAQQNLPAAINRQPGGGVVKAPPGGSSGGGAVTMNDPVHAPSPLRRYGNPKGNDSSAMGGHLGSGGPTKHAPKTRQEVPQMSLPSESEGPMSAQRRVGAGGYHPTQPASPGKARDRLINDVYGQTKMLHHDTDHDQGKWRPGGKNHDERKLNAMAEQKAILQQQMEEIRQRKQEEKERLRREDEEDERRVYAEMAELAVQNGMQPMAPIGPGGQVGVVASPTRRYGNPVGNNSSAMGSHLGLAAPASMMDKQKMRLSPDQRRQVVDHMTNQYEPLAPLPSKNVQRQRAHLDKKYEDSPPRHITQGAGAGVRSSPRGNVSFEGAGSPSKVRSFAGHGGHVFPAGPGGGRAAAPPPRAGIATAGAGVVPHHANPTHGVHIPAHGQVPTSHLHPTHHPLAASYESAHSHPGPGHHAGNGMDTSFQSQASYHNAYAHQGPQGGVDKFRPTSAEEVDSFLVNWQRQINMPQPRSGHAIAVQHNPGDHGHGYDPNIHQTFHPPEASLPSHSHPHHAPHGGPAGAHGSLGVNRSLDHHIRESGGDVSFVSDSRLIPSNPWDASGLMAALGPGVRQGEDHQGNPYKAASAVHSTASGHTEMPLGVNKFLLPSEKGQIKANHLQHVGLQAATMEQSLTSDSMLMYLGGRTPMQPLRGSEDSGGNATRGTSNSIDVFDAASGEMPDSPLSRLVKNHSRPASRPGTGDKSIHSRKELNQPDASPKPSWASPMPISTLPEHTNSGSKNKNSSNSNSNSNGKLTTMGSRENSSPHLNKSSPGSRSASQLNHSDLTRDNEGTEVDISLSELQVMSERNSPVAVTTTNTTDGNTTSGAGSAVGNVKREEVALQGLYDEYRADFEDGEDDEAIDPPPLSNKAIAGNSIDGNGDNGGNGNIGDGGMNRDGSKSKWDTSQASKYEIDAALQGNMGSGNVGQGVSSPSGEAGLSSSAMNYEDDEFYDETQDDIGSDLDPDAAYHIDVNVLYGKDIGPADFVALEGDDGPGPEPFIVLTVNGRNYASDRGVGVDPEYAQIVPISWDGYSQLHIQAMDQNDTDTELLGHKFVDLTDLNLSIGETASLDLELDDTNTGKPASLSIQLTLHQHA